MATTKALLCPAAIHPRHTLCPIPGPPVTWAPYHIIALMPIPVGTAVKKEARSDLPW